MRAPRLLDLTLSSPEENLALDDALLDDLDEHGGEPVLRLWESGRTFVVLGRSCRRAEDVHLAVCEADGVPVLRRASGGGTVLQGPGCLSYALVLPMSLHPDLADIRATYRFVLERMARALRRWEPAVRFCGISDLAIDGRKISGNAQRRTRRSLLLHGTILYAMPADLVARYLRQPLRQPDYRQDRPHAAFLRTIDVPPTELKEAIAAAWEAALPLARWPEDRLPACLTRVRERSATDPPPRKGSPHSAGGQAC